MWTVFWDRQGVIPFPTVDEPKQQIMGAPANYCHFIPMLDKCQNARMYTASSALFMLVIV
jgi:hypothetical protein